MKHIAFGVAIVLLAAMTRCKIISVKDNVIEIEGIDAFADTPVLDLKS